MNGAGLIAQAEAVSLAWSPSVLGCQTEEQTRAVREADTAAADRPSAVRFLSELIDFGQPLPLFCESSPRIKLSAAK
jgi:hypothetical protein